MDTILKSFSVGFFLRSTLSGVFFVLSMGTALGFLRQPNSEVPVTLIFALAVFSGATVYSCHRAVIYPVFEWASEGCP